MGGVCALCGAVVVDQSPCYTVYLFGETRCLVEKDVCTSDRKVVRYDLLVSDGNRAVSEGLKLRSLPDEH